MNFEVMYSIGARMVEEGCIVQVLGDIIVEGYTVKGLGIEW